MVNYLPVNSFVSKIYIIIKNNIKYFGVFSTWVALLYMYLFISMSAAITFNKRPDPLFDYLKILNYRIYISLLLILSIFLTTFFFFFANLKYQKANNIDKIYHYLNRPENYHPIIPLFMISVGFLLSTFYIFNSLFSIFGIWLFILGIFLLYIMLFIKSNWETKTYYTLHKASKILNDIDLDNKESNSLKEFNNYFIKFLNNIDRNLKKGIKINDMIKEENPSINIPVKRAIIYYLPEFMKFCNKEQIGSLKNRINQMKILVKKNDEFDLTISNIILDIYKDIDDFFHSNKFRVTEQKQGFHLPALKERELLLAQSPS